MVQYGSCLGCQQTTILGTSFHFPLLRCFVATGTVAVRCWKRDDESASIGAAHCRAARGRASLHLLFSWFSWCFHSFQYFRPWCCASLSIMVAINDHVTELLFVAFSWLCLFLGAVVAYGIVVFLFLAFLSPWFTLLPFGMF